MSNSKDAAQQAGIKRHALWLGAAALGVFVTYIVYVYVYVMIN